MCIIVTELKAYGIITRLLYVTSQGQQQTFWALRPMTESNSKWKNSLAVGQVTFCRQKTSLRGPYHMNWQAVCFRPIAYDLITLHGLLYTSLTLQWKPIQHTLQQSTETHQSNQKPQHVWSMCYHPQGDIQWENIIKL